ncbi:MAG: YtxH domain-containing protein [Siphonobacter sp.]
MRITLYGENHFPHIYFFIKFGCCGTRVSILYVELKHLTFKLEHAMSNNGKIFLGIVTAAAAGAVIGLLFAPDKGTDTRGKVKKQVNDIADELLKAIQKGKDTYEDLKDQATAKANDLKDRARSKFEDLQSQAEEVAQSAKKKINEEVN